MSRGFRAKYGFSYMKMEKVVRQVRHRLQMAPDEPIADGCEFFEMEASRYTVFSEQGRLPICYSCDSLPPEVEGLTIYSHDDREIIMSLSNETYTALRQNDGRARFSATHEFGHAVLHADLAISLGKIPHQIAALHRQQAPDHPSYLDTEWQANAFAGALLVPARGIRRLEEEISTTLHDLEWAIQREFGVSSDVAEIRLRLYRERTQELLNA